MTNAVASLGCSFVPNMRAKINSKSKKDKPKRYKINREPGRIYQL